MLIVYSRASGSALGLFGRPCSSRRVDQDVEKCCHGDVSYHGLFWLGHSARLVMLTTPQQNCLASGVKPFWQLVLN